MDNLNQDYKFRYVYQNKKTGEIRLYIRTIEEVELSPYQSIASFLSDAHKWQLIARDRWTTQKEFFESDIISMTIGGKEVNGVVTWWKYKWVVMVGKNRVNLLDCLDWEVIGNIHKTSIENMETFLEKNKEQADG